MPEYIIVNTAEEYKASAGLFTEYAQWLGIDLSFQHFDEELQALEKMYGPPDGGIILCKDNDKFIACVAIRKFEEGIAELKRMYVQPACQHKGIGKILMERSIELARSAGYKKIVLDTLNDMTPAIQLYTQYGFTETTAYYYNPNATVVYFKKDL
jgi:putative acetyltransferase